VTGLTAVLLAWAEWALQGLADVSLDWISLPLSDAAKACRSKRAELRTVSTPKDRTNV
jgi:hypothetical protein